MTTKHFSPELVNQRRMTAVRLRLSGKTIAETAVLAQLSPPTVSAAWKAFKEGGWSAVPVKPRGRPSNVTTQTHESWQQAALNLLYQTPSPNEPGWSCTSLAAALNQQTNASVDRRLVSHWWQQEGLQVASPLASQASFSKAQAAYFADIIAPLWKRLPNAKQRWSGGLRTLAGGQGYQLYFHGAWKRLYIRCFKQPPTADDYLSAFDVLARIKPSGLAFQGADLLANPDIRDWLDTQDQFWLVPLPSIFTH